MDRRSFLRSMGGAAGAVCLGAGAPASVWARPGPAGDERFFKLLRSQFQLPPDYAYLNTGGLGASPLVVSHTVKERIDREERKPSPGHNDADWWAIKEKFAALFGPGVKKEELAFTSTTTEGLNIILRGLPLQAGDEVITTTHEHPALSVPLLHGIRTRGIKVRTFTPDGLNRLGNLERIKERINKRTRLILLSHVTCTAGQVMPAKAIGELARSAGIWFALDGAQAAGQVPVCLADLGVDCYALSGHKWLLGPKRTGLLYVREAMLDRVQPLVVGAYSEKAQDLAAGTLTFQPSAQRYEYGTQNDALIYGLEAAVDFLTGIGLESLWARNRRLSERFYKGLQAIDSVEILSPTEAMARSTMITFRLRDKDNAGLCADLTRNNFRVRRVGEADLDGIRVGWHLYNNEQEVDQLLEEIQKRV